MYHQKMKLWMMVITIRSLLVSLKFMEVEDTPQITRELSKKSMVRRYMKAKGIKDKEKKTTLLKVIKEAE